ncbi:MAG TPA: A/G-specific adenine glycosylase [Actinomycetota bacterium]|nr:A/G-specific adenine glycosylase [Actinomycetota bacterium]
MSEVMLQQTQAARVAPAFEAFMARFPDVRTLAAAPLGDVLRAWGRLGYPRRALALHRAAGEIVERYGAVVPRDPEALRTLAGVGDYTSAAIASLAYGRAVAAVDTNVRRIVARVEFGVEADEVSRRGVDGAAGRWLDPHRPGAWNQALMDLGREVCRPAPRCAVCPLRAWCAFAAAGRRGRPATRRQPPFEGSMRQVRGAVTAELRERSPRTIGGIARATGHSVARVVEAVRGLHGDGLVAATEAALAGRSGGRVSFPDESAEDLSRAVSDGSAASG